MKVLIICSEPYQHKESPMLGIFQKDQFEALSSLKFDVFILSPAGRSFRYAFSRSNSSMETEVDLNNIYRTDKYNFTPRITFLERSIFVYRGLQLFKSIINASGLPDVIHAHNALYAGELAQIISKKWGVPYVITEHSSWILKNIYKGKQKKSIQYVYKNAKQVLAVGCNLAEVIQGEYKCNNVKVIPNIIPEDFTKNVDEIANNRNQLNYKEFRIINVASLDSNKNQIGIIKAFSEFKKTYATASLVLIGNGPAKAEILALITELGLESSVKLLGCLSRSQIAEQLGMSHLFVLGSYFETFGVVAIEANALGLPVLSTPCGGVNDIIVNMFNGLILEDNTCNEILRGMKIIQTNYADFDPKSIAEFTQKKYSSVVIANQLMSIYKSL